MSNTIPRAHPYTINSKNKHRTRIPTKMRTHHKTDRPIWQWRKSTNCNPPTVAARSRPSPTIARERIPLRIISNNKSQFILFLKRNPSQDYLYLRLLDATPAPRATTHFWRTSSLAETAGLHQIAPAELPKFQIPIQISSSQPPHRSIPSTFQHNSFKSNWHPIKLAPSPPP